MKRHSFIFILIFASSATFAADDSQPSLYVPDGQLLAIPVKLYVSSSNLDLTMKPRLQLAGSDAHDRTNVSDLRKWEPFVAAPNQSWTEMVDGQSVTHRGTLLMFDLNQFGINYYKSTTRVTPILTWQPADLKDGASAPQIVGNWVYLGSRPIAGIWTVIAIGALVAILWLMASAHGKSVLYLLSGPDGYMSLWRTQLAAWTLTVGSMVFLFGIIQLGVPRIPESLVVLMGMAVATGSLSAIAGKPSQPAASAPAGTGAASAATGAGRVATPAGTGAASAATGAGTVATPAGTGAAPAATGAGAPPPAPKPLWSHLISTFDPTSGQVLLSVTKAQMVFWTGVIVVLFVAKSLLSGELWTVPWELVTLTGVSQAGYVGDKALKGKT